MKGCKTESCTRRLLGITRPWGVEGVALDMQAREVIVRVAVDDDEELKCPSCFKPCGRHDTRERKWRHLDTMQMKTRRQCCAPAIRCSGAGRQARARASARPSAGLCAPPRSSTRAPRTFGADSCSELGSAPRSRTPPSKAKRRTSAYRGRCREHGLDANGDARAAGKSGAPGGPAAAGARGGLNARARAGPPGART